MPSRPRSARLRMLGLDPLLGGERGQARRGRAPRAQRRRLGGDAGPSVGGGAAIIGECVEDHPSMVVVTTTFGGTRVVDTPLGEQLPRIC